MEKRAAGIVIFRKITQEFEYLLLQTSYGHHHWTPPKGYVEPGETDIDTALRETKEESGILKEDLKVVKGFQKTIRYPVNGVPKTVIYWLAELINIKPIILSSEHRDYKWGNIKTSMELAVYKDTQELLQECENYLQLNYKFPIKKEDKIK